MGYSDAWKECSTSWDFTAATVKATLYAARDRELEAGGDARRAVVMGKYMDDGLAQIAALSRSGFYVFFDKEDLTRNAVGEFNLFVDVPSHPLDSEVGMLICECYNEHWSVAEIADHIHGDERMKPIAQQFRVWAGLALTKLAVQLDRGGDEE